MGVVTCNYDPITLLERGKKMKRPTAEEYKTNNPYKEQERMEKKNSIGDQNSANPALMLIVKLPPMEIRSDLATNQYTEKIESSSLFLSLNLIYFPH